MGQRKKSKGSVFNILNWMKRQMHQNLWNAGRVALGRNYSFKFI
jgi:hypothetical protein